MLSWPGAATVLATIDSLDKLFKLLLLASMVRAGLGSRTSCLRLHLLQPVDATSFEDLDIAINCSGKP